MIESLTTASDVIDALDGTTAVARIAGRKPQHVTNWRASGRFPPNTYLVITEALREKGKSAPASLWGMKTAAPPMAPDDADSDAEQVRS